MSIAFVIVNGPVIANLIAIFVSYEPRRITYHLLIFINYTKPIMIIKYSIVYWL